MTNERWEGGSGFDDNWPTVALPGCRIRNQKQEEELKCRRSQLLQKIGNLGNSIKVELFSRPGQLVDIAKVLCMEVLRKPLKTHSNEWFGFDQNRLLLITEFLFDSPVNDQNKEQLVEFERTLKAFVATAKTQLFPTDNFLTQFAFCDLQCADRAEFSLNLLIGQYIELGSKCLGTEKVLDELRAKKKTILPRIANHLLCGLNTLHDQRFVHGNISLDSVWINSDNNFFISDHSLLLEISNLFSRFECINTDNEQQQGLLNPSRLKDFQAFGNLLKLLFADSDVSLADRETFDDFIFQCTKYDVNAQKLLNHRFLYQGFTAVYSSTEESCLSSVDSIPIENAGRLLTEYNILGFLGSGGFGSVFLARNKLDGNDYAIKRISLSGMSQKEVERIKNEVAVFSRLTHEHITRYYSSWVENITLSIRASESTTTDSCKSDALIENELPECLRNPNTEGSNHIGESTESLGEDSNKSSSSDVKMLSDDSQRQRPPSVLPSIMSDGGSDLSIMFVGSENVDRSSEVSDSEFNSEISQGRSRTASFLCLQMEYCVNKTLRSLIDYSQLYSNPAMIWRLFKEILQGLDFMHSYNLIHRDIKPGNIFLDANWNVKLGDFGLATRLATVPASASEINISKELNKNRAVKSGSMTKDVGTTLYIPPEAKRITSLTKNYNAKFDIYSVGIVLFEMIMPPFNSVSERIYCIEKLRNELVMPDGYSDGLPESQRKNADLIITWCLNSNPQLRPSTRELLRSNHLPQIISDEDELHKLFSQIAYDHKNRLRRSLFNELFSPLLPPSIGHIYDKKYCNGIAKNRKISLFKYIVVNYLSNFFRLHGFSQLSVESLLPSSENYSLNNGGTFESLSKPYKVIDQDGMILMLPTNLRQSLVRYFAHNGITRSRSYSIDKTYSKSSNTLVLSSHPETRTEFCLDILKPKISSSDSIALEVLQLVIQITRKLRPLSTNRWQILLNHVALIKAVAIHSSINDEERICNFLNLLYDFSSRVKKLEYNSLTFELVRNLHMPEKQAQELIKLIDFPNQDIQKLREQLRSIINTKSSKAKALIERAINELDLVFQSLSPDLDSHLEFLLLPSFVYQPRIFDDLVFSLRVEINERGKKFWCPILAGGCYDVYLEKNRHIRKHSADLSTSAYGFNLSVENIAHLLKNSSANIAEKFGLVPSILISSTSASYLNSAHALADQLREVSMSAEIWNGEVTLDEAVFEYARDNSINFIGVIVGVDELVIYVKAFDQSVSADNEYRLLYNRISLAEAFRHISHSIRKELSDSDIQSRCAETLESTSAYSTAVLSNVNLVYNISRGQKLTHHVKKKYESQVFATLTTLVKRFSKNTKIDAYITELPIEIVTQIGNLDRSVGRDQIFADFEAIASDQCSRFKKEVMLLFDELEPYFKQPVTTNHVIFLFCPRYNESFYRILL